MKTSKPFATISYNTDDFLTIHLDNLVQDGFIAFWSFIEHLPEEDETKKHKHLYLVPNGRVDTEQIRNYLTEIDPSMPLEKPLKCLPCKSSKFADWYLYGLHDVRYLASKGQSRKYHYTQQEFIVSDNDFFVEEVHTIDMSKLNRLDALVNAVDNNVPFELLVRNGVVPLQQYVGYERAYRLLSGYNTYRNNSIGHDEYVDMTTGEVEFDPDLHLQFEIAHLEKKAQASKPKGTK